jgi:protein-arginine kinase activator protein McsA
MIVCGLTLDDNSDLAVALRNCAECAATREDTVIDDMTGEQVLAGNEVCAAHGQEVAQAGVLLRKIQKTDSSIQDKLDDWEYRSN